MCIYVTFSGLLMKKDKIPTIEAKELTVSKGPEDIQFHQLPRNNVQMDKENTPIQCTNDGCTDEFAIEKEFLHHQFVGNAILKWNLNPVPIQILLIKVLTCTLLKLFLTQVLFNKRRMQVRCFI